MANEFINISVTQRGAEQVYRDIAHIGDGANSSARALALLQRSLSLIGGGFAASQLKELVDGYTNLSNRLRLVSTDSYNLAQLQTAVFQAAQRTRTPMAALAQLYSRTALNTAALGLSQQEVLGITESVSQAFQISGATAAEASGSIIQFTQGLAQGTLRGQELNSVLEQAPRLAQAIAEGMGVGVYDLKRLGKEGKITSEAIVDALKKAAPELREEFAKLRPTIDSAFTVLNNGFMQTIGQLDQATGASAKLAEMMIFVGNNSKLMTAILVAGAGLAVIAFAPLIASAISLAVALAMNPLTWIVGAIVAIGVFGNDIKVTADRVVSLMDWLRAAFSVVMELAAPAGQWLMSVFGTAWEWLKSTWGGISDFFANNFDELVELAKVFYGVYVSIFSGLVSAIGAVFQNLPAVIEGIFKTMWNTLLASTEAFLTALVDGINAIGGAIGINIPPPDFSGLKAELSKEAQDAPVVIADAFREGFERGGVLAEQALNAVGDTFDKINDKARGIANSRSWRDAVGALFAPNGGLPNVPVDRLSDEDEKAKKDALREEKTLLEDILGAKGKLVETQATLDRLMAKGLITQEQYNTKMRELTLAVLEADTSMQSGLMRGLMKIEDQIRDVASVAENALTNAFTNAEDALVKFVTTGKLDFKDFIDSLLADLARLAIRQALLGLLNLATGGIGGTAVGAVGAAIGGAVGKKDGGLITGPGTGTSDSILARLSDGEFVMNADATRMFYPLLKAMNDNKKLPAYAAGGLVGSRGGSGTLVQVVDQRSNGGSIVESRSRNRDGSETVRLIVRDELEAVHLATEQARAREARGFRRKDTSLGNF